MKCANIDVPDHYHSFRVKDGFCDNCRHLLAFRGILNEEKEVKIEHKGKDLL